MEEGVARLAGRLRASRHARFVGRTAERALVESALASETLPFQVLYVFGPGGIGKTSLIREFAYLCQQSNVPIIALDGREIEPSPVGFIGALRSALGLDPADSPEDALSARSGRLVMLVDTYEALAPLDAWLRETFLPLLSERILVVLAGRNAPAPAWRADPGWQTLLRVLPLRNLAPDESRSYLSQCSVPVDQHQLVLDFTHGHPLALSLVVDAFAQRGNLQFSPDAAPDIVRTLVEHLVQRVEPEQRAALEACSLARSTTEALLAELLSTTDAHAMFEWLRSLSFIETGPHGIFPHDLPRDALVADLRWRHPDWYAELHRRARSYSAARLAQARGQEQQRILFDYVYLHRDNPLMRPYLEWQEVGATMPDTFRPNDRADLLRLVQRHEGRESARWLDFWLDRQPARMVVYRDVGGEPSGFVFELALHEAAPEDRLSDPATLAAWQYLERHAPLRSGEGATLFRFWMAGDGYQAVSALQSLIFGRAAQHYLATPGLAFSFFPVADVAFWAPMFTHVDIPRLAEAEFEIGGRHYGVFAHDWRARPPLAWLSLLGEREITASDDATPAPAITALVLSEPEFAAAIHDALRHFTRADGLRDSPLLRSRLVLDLAGASEIIALRIEALRSLLLQAAASLQASPREAKLYRALDRTYFHPAATQEQAAELLDLPFSTYRRHLKAAIERVTATLWQREINPSTS